MGVLPCGLEQDVSFLPSDVERSIGLAGASSLPALTLGPQLAGPPAELRPRQPLWSREPVPQDKSLYSHACWYCASLCDCTTLTTGSKPDHFQEPRVPPPLCRRGSESLLSDAPSAEPAQLQPAPHEALLGVQRPKGEQLAQVCFKRWLLNWRSFRQPLGPIPRGQVLAQMFAGFTPERRVLISSQGWSNGAFPKLDYRLNDVALPSDFPARLFNNLRGDKGHAGSRGAHPSPACAVNLRVS